jgi:hypothetical protein
MYDDYALMYQILYCADEYNYGLVGSVDVI